MTLVRLVPDVGVIYSGILNLAVELRDAGAFANGNPRNLLPRNSERAISWNMELRIDGYS